MPNTMSGRGQLRALPPAQGEFEVNYEIHVGTENVGQAPGGLPPVTRPRLNVTKMQTTDGRPIPDGQYVLTDGQTELLRLAKESFGKWYGIN
jgi:hypothetical protein